MDNLQKLDGNRQLEMDAASSVYATDEFRLYCHKILPCSKRTPHDWTSCHFAHPGEKAKRRNIRTHSYDCEMCPNIVKGIECKLGANCPHSHNVFESWLHPQKYRTMMCKDRDKCTRPVCFFAHGPFELRTPTDPAPLPQQINLAAMAAGTAAWGTPGQGPNVAAAAAGMTVGSSMQDWQLMQSQVAELAHAGDTFSQRSSSFGHSGSVSAPAGVYIGPGTPPFISSSQASSLLHAGSPHIYPNRAGFSAAAGVTTAFSPHSNSYSNGLELAGNEQLARLIQQANNNLGTTLPPHSGLPVQQLMNSLAQQVHVSRQEPQQSTNAAAFAQQQLMAMTAALGLQGAGSASSSTSLPVVSVSQQLRMGSACGSNNLDMMLLDGSDLSSNTAFRNGSSGTLPDMSGSAHNQQQLYTATAAGNSAWTSAIDSSAFMPSASRTGSTSASMPIAGWPGQQQMGTAGGSACAPANSQGSYGNAISLAAAGHTSAVVNHQLQQQLPLRQAFGSPVRECPGAMLQGQQPLLTRALGAHLGQLDALQQHQHMQFLQQSLQQASRATPVSTTAGGPPLIYLM